MNQFNNWQPMNNGYGEANQAETLNNCENQNVQPPRKQRGILLTILYIVTAPIRWLWRFIKWIFKSLSLDDILDLIFDAFD